MSKGRALKEHLPRRDLMREQLAHQAAKLMAQDGITDHAFAKRKAARQLGATDTQHLPSNEEINTALHSFRTLFQGDKHPAVLRQLRDQALAIMRTLEMFHPYLTGSVLSGMAGEHSDINLMLFSDDAKAVLLFLIKHDIDFEDGTWRIQINGREEYVPSYTLTGNTGVQAHLVLWPENARFSGSRKPDTHADIAALEKLLAA